MPLKPLNPMIKSSAAFNLNQPKRQIGTKISLTQIQQQRRNSLCKSGNLIDAPNKSGNVGRRSSLIGSFQERKQLSRVQFSEDFNSVDDGNVVESDKSPQFTSCCPAWVNYVEKLHHELIPNLSTTKSPHMILLKLVKTYFASINNIDANEIFLVSLMPCVAKKDEIKWMQLAGDCDAVLTSKEFISLINDFGIDF